MSKRPRATESDYERAYYRARVAFTLVDLLLDEYPRQPPAQGSAERAADLNDIAASLEAITAGWAAEQLAATGSG